MLESDYQNKLEILLGRLRMGVKLPEGWTNYFQRRGMLPAIPAERRRYARRFLREEAICEVNKSLPAIERRHEFAKAYLKDFSRTGVAFMNMHELYPGEALYLWTRQGKLNCSVVRCVKHNDRCYEVGASFE